MGSTDTLNGQSCNCTSCGKHLCLRQQVINLALALGNVDERFCLSCLGRDGSQDPSSVLAGVKKYILSRACFKRQWVKYEDVTFCPEPETCFPAICFQASEEDE